MTILTTIQNILDKIPMAVVTIRDLITKGLISFNLSSETSMIVFMVIAFFLAYLYLKTFIVSGWMKISTLLNLVLLALLIYVGLVYVK